MAALDSRETLSNLRKKGFTESAIGKSKDHIRVEYIHEGKLTRINTKFSHDGQDINDYLISQMSKQIGLSKKEFKDFAKCLLSQSGYIDLLKSKNII